MRTASLLAALSLLVPAGASAQRRLAQDTLSASTPGVVSCGFCAGERFGVVFRDLPSPLRGLEPEDFPVELDTVEIAVAAASPTAGCAPAMTGGTITAPVEIYVGDTIPPEDVSDFSETEWEGETLIWAAEAPLTLSVADDTGRYSVSFNAIDVRDEAGERIRIDSGAYLRVVVAIPEGEAGSSPSCEAGGFPSPAGFPFRDNAGETAEPFRGTAQRSLTYALGIGWLWNSEGHSPVPVIPGNWGIRLSVSTLGPGPSAPDAGMPDGGRASDAGAAQDAGIDAGAIPSDAGVLPAGGGCACRVSAGSSSAAPLGLIVAALCLLRRRRRR